MADKKISQLTALSAANVASATDVLAIVDTSATETKKITAKDLIDGALNGGTANGVLYLNGSKVATSGSALVFDGTNLGLGVTPTAMPSAWKSFEVGYAGNKLTSGSSNDISIYSNAGAWNGSAFTYAANGLAARYNQNAGAHYWFTAASGSAGGAIDFGSAKMTLDASGNLLLGTTAAAYGLFNCRNGAAYFQNANGDGIKIQNVARGSSPSFMGLANGAASIAAIGEGVALPLGIGTFGAEALIFGTNNTERARITSGGDLLVGTTTSQDLLTVNGGATLNGGLDFSVTGTKNWQVVGNATDFYIGDQTLTRYAQLQGITTFTAWTFVSDRRLKHQIKDLHYGLDALMQIRPREFNFIKDDQFSIGFVAQELKEIIPEAVTGNEIEFTDNDSPEERASKTMGVSKEMLIPVLVKAIQEQQAMIKSLEAKVAALEAK